MPTWASSACTTGGGERLLLRELHQHLRIDDIFGRGKLEQRLDVRQLHAAGLRLERVLVGLKGELATRWKRNWPAPETFGPSCASAGRATGWRSPCVTCISSRGVGLRLQAGTALVLDKDGLSLRGLDARIARLQGGYGPRPA